MPVRRTVTEADNIWFTLLTNNTNQIHFNNEYGKRTEFGKCLINSALTLAIVAGMGVADVSENGFALGWDEIKLPNPLFAGDTLYSESEVLEKRESKSKPQWGILKVRTRGVQQEVKSSSITRSVMVWKKPMRRRRICFRRLKRTARNESFNSSTVQKFKVKIRRSTRPRLDHIKFPAFRNLACFI